jgi:hypothetical protein
MALTLQFISLAFILIGLLLNSYPHYYTSIKKKPVFLSSRSLLGNSISIILPCIFGLLMAGIKKPSIVSISTTTLLGFIIIWNLTRPKTITAHHINLYNFQKELLVYLKENQIEFEKAPSLIHVMNPKLEISFSGDHADFKLENNTDWKALNVIVSDLQAKNLKSNNSYAHIFSIFGILLIIFFVTYFISASK